MAQDIKRTQTTTRSNDRDGRTDDEHNGDGDNRIRSRWRDAAESEFCRVNWRAVTA